MPKNNNNILKINLSAIPARFQRKAKAQLCQGNGKWVVKIKRTKETGLTSFVKKTNSHGKNTRLLPKIIPKKPSLSVTRERIISQGLCSNVISFGSCFEEDQCNFFHDLDKELVINAIQCLCKDKHFEKARSLLGAIVLASPDSPFYGWLYTHAGKALISNVCHLLQINPSNSSFDLSRNTPKEYYFQELLLPFMDHAVNDRGPNVVVEPSYETEKELQRAFTDQDFDRVANLLFQFYTDSPNCPILASLLFLIKTHPLEDRIVPDQSLTVGDIVIQIIICACKKDSPNSLPLLKKQALLDLSLGALHYLWEMDSFLVKKIKYRPHQQDTHNFLNNLFVCQMPVLEIFTSRPHLLVFAAECCLQPSSSDVNILTDYNIISALNFLIEFQKAALKLDNVDQSVVMKEFELHTYILQLIEHMKGNVDFNYNSVIAVKYDYEEASLKNKSKFQALTNIKC